MWAHRVTKRRAPALSFWAGFAAPMRLERLAFMVDKTVRAHQKTGLRAFAVFGAGLFGIAALSGLPLRAAMPDGDAPAMIGGKAVALSVTGEGEVEVKATDYYLVATFYNDATGPDAATAQNVQAEALLQKSVTQAGILISGVSFPYERRVGFPSTSGDIGGVMTTSAGPPRATETARAARTIIVRGRDFAGLPKLITALQSVGASGFINISYGFGESKALRNQTLKKAVADAMEQTKILEAASLPRKLHLLALEPGEFIGASVPTMGYPLSVPKSPGSGTPSASLFTSISAPVNGARQSVILRYALVDSPAPVKSAIKPVAAKETAKPAR